MNIKWWILLAVVAVVVVPIKLKILKKVLERKKHEIDE